MTNICEKCYNEGTDACIDCGLLPTGKCPALQFSHVQAYGTMIGRKIAEAREKDTAEKNNKN